MYNQIYKLASAARIMVHICRITLWMSLHINMHVHFVHIIYLHLYITIESNLLY